MRIAWFTPFSSKSAIGLVGARICQHLSKSCTVDIWTHDREYLIQTDLEIKHFDSHLNVKSLDVYDHVIYNIGNFAGYHREIYDVSRKKPGVVILHDQTMANFWSQYHLMPDFGGNPYDGLSKYMGMFQRYYGPEAAKLAKEAFESGHFPINEYKTLPDYALLEPVVENAMGIYTHAKFFLKDLCKIYNGPVEYSYLPYEEIAMDDAADEEMCQIIHNARKKGKKIIVSTGIVHPVKRIDKIVKLMLRQHKLADKLCYIVVGSYGGKYGDSLALVAREKLKNSFHMLGYQTEANMHYAIKHSDMCINLRYPNSEVCSLSLLEQMSSGKPVMVLDSGIYGELPNDSVIRIHLDREEQEINSALKALCDGSFDFGRIGENGAAFVKNECSTDIYCHKLLRFLSSLGKDYMISQFQNKLIGSARERLQDLNFHEENLPLTINCIVKGIWEGLFHSKVIERMEKGATVEEGSTLGVWAGFRYSIPGLNREGVSRFMSYMVTALVKRYDDLAVEVWCYAFNRKEVEICFSELLEDPIYSSRVRVITEKNWLELCNPREQVAQQIGPVNEVRDNLSTVARMFSKARCFIPFIIYLDNVIGTEKPVFVPAHDMTVSDHYDEFIAKDPTYKFRMLDIASRAENLARYGATFFCISKAVCSRQVLKYVRNLREDHTRVIYLPVNAPLDIKSRLVGEKAFRAKHGIDGRYFYYPTQIRPYKNINAIIKAVHMVSNEYEDLKLVLTGDPNDQPDVVELIKAYGMENRIILAKNLSEEELFSGYRYAAGVPVASFFEGGFPLQASEAMFMETPVALGEIDVCKERIQHCGFTLEDCGLLLFSPESEHQLAQCLRLMLEDRGKVLESQKKFSERLLSYGWDDAAHLYHNLFFGETMA